jgi:diguanylate cyclase (GGDEF)-like protein
MDETAAAPTAAAATPDGNRDAAGYVEPFARRQRALEQLAEIAMAVVTEVDISTLTQRVLLEARRFTNAEAGSLFLRRGADLIFTAVQNDALEKMMSREKVTALFMDAPVHVNEQSVAGFVAGSGTTLNIPDVNAIPAGTPYTFNRSWDATTGYRTQSVLVVPLTGRGGNNVGALELINARDAAGGVIPFDPDDERLLCAMAAQAAVAVDHARLTELSLVDSVTGAYNRRYFVLRLEEEIKRYKRHQEPFAIVIFDLDHFKSINDRFGHLTGDRALQMVGGVLTGQSRGFTVIARLGGDEFAAILPSTPKSGAMSYSERIRRVIETYPFDGHQLTVSTGIAAVPDDITGDALNPESITDAADRALYDAKRNGRNRTGTL